MRSTSFNETARQRRGSLEIILLVVLASLGCAGNAGRDADAQPAARRAVERDEAAAAAALHGYFDAIADGDHTRAYDYWVDRSARGMTLEEFRRRYANVTAVDAGIGEGRISQRDPSAVGSQTVVVPVMVQISHANGSQECLQGTYSMSKAVVPGARWLIGSSDLQDC